MNRRGFLALGAGALGWLRAAGDAHAQAAQGDIPFGESRLGISNGLRDGTLYVRNGTNLVFRRHC